MNEHSDQALPPNRPRAAERANDENAWRREFLAQWAAGRGQLGDSNSGAQPFPGLRSFRPEEADLFFGRESQIQDLRRLLSDRNLIVVLGGSGSGKSSLVRGGLLPKLSSTAPIPGRAGAWYVVEFRPRTDPASELFEAVFNQIIEPVLTLPEKLAHTELSAESEVEAAGVDLNARLLSDRDRSYRALRTALGVEEFAPDTDVEIVRSACRARLRTMLYEGNAIDVGALFEFAEVALRLLDESLSDHTQSAPPNLLILIDQFEEVFKKNVAPAGRDMIMSCLTSVHAYKPFNLFLVVTMRSEELHRCSEFPGVADVVNSSFYLLDLIGGFEIEQAIVGPAWRVLKSWNLEAGNAETGPFTRGALSKLRDVFDEGRGSLPHPADQLPLMQHLLPLVWDRAVESWQHSDDESAPLRIDIRQLEAIPGWRSSDGPLIGCLNAHADAVLENAIQQARRIAPSLGIGAVQQLLQAAFTTLAQLDDRGNVVRDFADIGKMLDASGVVETGAQLGERDCIRGLKAALAEFQQASLIGLKSAEYDVSHEAFIRGWQQYVQWLADERLTRDRLVAADKMVQEKYKRATPDGIGDQLADVLAARRYADADRVVGDETSARLQAEVLGPNRTFSRSWARGVLGAASGDDAPAIDGRLNDILATMRDAELWRSRFWHRYRPAVIVSSVAITLTGLALTIWFFFTIELSRRNDQLLRSAQVLEETSKNAQEQFDLFRLSTTSISRNPFRNPQEDLESYQALKIAAETRPQLLKTGQKEANLEATLQQLDEGIRKSLSDLSLRVTSNTEELRELNPQPAKCVKVQPDLDQLLHVTDARGDRGFESALDEKVHRWKAVWRGSNVTSNISGIPWPPGSLVCLSHDANWLLSWPADTNVRNRPSNTPEVRRIMWLRKGSLGTSNWHALALDNRSARTPAGWTQYSKLAPIFGSLEENGKREISSIKSFQHGHRVGFVIPMADGQESALLWTLTGFSDPEWVGDAHVVKDSPWPLVPCNEMGALPWQKTGRKLTTCDLKDVEVEGRQTRVLVQYADPIESDPVFPGESARRCALGNPFCISSVFLSFSATPIKSRLSITDHIAGTVTDGAYYSGHLWLRDQNDQVWRYVVDSNELLAALEGRVKGLDAEIFQDTPVTDACHGLSCPPVPGAPPSAAVQR
jgi:hypothetical protein